MVLSDKKILEAKEKGHIIISPYDERNLSTSSYDVTLGEFYYKPTTRLQDKVYNIYNEEQTKTFWGEVRKAEYAASVMDETIGIKPKDRIILVHPGESILAHTIEFIGGRDHITTMMKARSSMGRQGISVALCAGWGDVGYINRWTLEIKNHNKHYTIPLVVGRRIAQLVFMDTGPILDKGKDYAAKGKYQSSQLLEELQAEWKPEDMLPKLWKDRDAK